MASDSFWCFVSSVLKRSMVFCLPCFCLNFLSHPGSLCVALILKRAWWLLGTFLSKSLSLLSFREEPLFSLWRLPFTLGFSYLSSYSKYLILSIFRHLLYSCKALFVIVFFTAWIRFLHTGFSCFNGCLQRWHLLLNPFQLFLFLHSTLSSFANAFQLQLILDLALF